MTGFDIQCRCFPVELACTSVCPKEAKRCDFGSVVDRSMIHFRLKCLTKPAGSYKQSYNLNLCTGSFQCGAEDIK